MNYSKFPPNRIANYQKARKSIITGIKSCIQFGVINIGVINIFYMETSGDISSS